MNYTYSICHPDKPKIEHPSQVLSTKEVSEMIASYSWLEILKLMENIDNDKIYYSPSLDFKNQKDSYSLGITATLENGKPEFSLWYNRPITKRSLFGLLAPKTKMEVIDKWGFTIEQALKYYSLFLNQEYKRLEELMNQ